MTSDGEMTKTKVVDLKKLYNFVVDNFFIWNHLSMKKSREFAHIWNSNFSNDLGWRNNQNKSCSSQKIMQLYSWRLFSFEIIYPRKSHMNFLTFEIRIFQTTSDGEMTKTKFVDLKKLLNFVVDNFFFSIYYGPKYSFQNKMNIYSSTWNIATTLLFTFKLNAKYQETIFH